MRRIETRPGLFSLATALLWSLVVVNATWAQTDVSFVARRDFHVGTSRCLSGSGRLQR